MEVGKKYKLLFKVGFKRHPYKDIWVDRLLYYLATITEITATHISFTDKFGKEYTYLREYLVESSPQETQVEYG